MREGAKPIKIEGPVDTSRAPWDGEWVLGFTRKVSMWKPVHYATAPGFGGFIDGQGDLCFITHFLPMPELPEEGL